MTEAALSLKRAIDGSCGRILFKWIRIRMFPAICGVSMIVVPSTLTMIGFAEGIANAGRYDKTRDKISTICLVIGYATSFLIPVGILLLKRQLILTTRDIWLYNKFSSLGTQLNPQHLPSSHEISSMNDLNSLLRLAKHYFEKEGNFFERLSLSVPGLRGYKLLKNK